MKLTVLGSGTCVPSLKRNAPGYFLEAEGWEVLVDCGPGTLLQLERAGKSYKDIDAVFITHRHPDHFNDLMPLVQALIATPKFKREKELYIVAPGGFSEYYDNAITTILGTHLNFPLELIEVNDRLVLGPLTVFADKTVHSIDSTAYRFGSKGRSIVFTGDADFESELVKFVIGADLLVADCSFPESMKMQGHMSAKECGILAQKAGVKKLLLSHIYPSGTPDADRVTESKEAFEGEVVLAEDLMEIEV